jgi:hypothetical protein
MLVVGKLYKIKLTSGMWTEGKFLGEIVRGAGNLNSLLFSRRRTRRHYQFENIRTGRIVELKSLQKVREYTLNL